MSRGGVWFWRESPRGRHGSVTRSPASLLGARIHVYCDLGSWISLSRMFIYNVHIPFGNTVSFRLVHVLSLPELLGFKFHRYHLLGTRRRPEVEMGKTLAMNGNT